MNEILLLMVLVFAAYLFLPSNWFSSFFSKANRKAIANSHFNEKLLLIPEDSVLRRHYITQLRLEIETELSDSSLLRYYNALLAEKLENGTATLSA